MDIRDVWAIDVHSHYGVSLSQKPEPFDELSTGDEQVILKRMDAAKIKCSVVSPIAAMMPRGHGRPVPANEDAAAVCAQNERLFQWVVLNPLEPDTYGQAERMLMTKKCIGIKIHPEEHLYPIKQHGAKIFEFAARFGAIVQSHSGEQNSNPLDFVPFADEYPDVKLVLSHIGCGWDGDVTRQVRAIQAARHGNIYSDTSSAKSILPGLIEWAVREGGSDHIMFGTDTPLYYAPMQRARIDAADMGEEHKLNILCRTALKLFGGALEEAYNR